MSNPRQFELAEENLVGAVRAALKYFDPDEIYSIVDAAIVELDFEEQVQPLDDEGYEQLW
ncbi:MAG: hypothetical protein AMS18_00290 [Gemmatimonas sp. SG8_17]|nr:MAG: hypothetical protein AMS18_00290 [Gemmatimonas sp. SG8_17]